MASQELVPSTYARDAYNALHGTRLVGHNGLLSHEQATQINEHYDVEIYVGTHGQGLSSRTKGIERASTDEERAIAIFIAPPTNAEYDAAASVVDGMQPGDTLFVEGYGFQEQPPDPIRIPERRQGERLSFSSSLLDAMLQGAVEVARTELEKTRSQYRIGAWDYAAQLAMLRGIRVVAADIDAYDLEAFRAMTGVSSLAWDGRVPQTDDLHGDRDRRARDILKDYALEHLDGERVVDGRKPKLVMFYGSDHKDGLTRVFRQAHLHAKIEPLASTDTGGRVQEQAERLLRQLALAVVTPMVRVPLSPDPGRRIKEYRDAHTAGQAAAIKKGGLAGPRGARFKDLGRFGGQRPRSAAGDGIPPDSSE